MAIFYQITNKNQPPKQYAYIRRWFLNAQSIFIDNTLIRFIVRESNSKAAFELAVHITNQKSNKKLSCVLLPGDYLDMSTLGVFISIRAAEWTASNKPSRFLVEFISLYENTQLHFYK